MVVLAIIGLIVSISIPSLTGYSQQVRLKAAARQVVGLVSLARSRAIGTRQEQAVVVDVEHGQVSVVDVSSGEVLEPVVRVPPFISIHVQVGEQSAAEPQLVFRATGALTGRTTSITLADRQHQQTITVIGATGAVSVD